MHLSKVLGFLGFTASLVLAAPIPEASAQFACGAPFCDILKAAHDVVELFKRDQCIPTVDPQTRIVYCPLDTEERDQCIPTVDPQTGIVYCPLDTEERDQCIPTVDPQTGIVYCPLNTEKRDASARTDARITEPDGTGYYHDDGGKRDANAAFDCGSGADVELRAKVKALRDAQIEAKTKRDQCTPTVDPLSRYVYCVYHGKRDAEVVKLERD